MKSLALIILGSLAGTALAGDLVIAPTTVSKQVRFDDLDRATANGRRELERRVRKAAWDVCTLVQPANGANAVAHGRCIAEVAQNAMRKIGSPGDARQARAIEPRP